ncbi:hypothetical protein WS68_14165 [Burkholderia sp. TSV86]|nr:hypothetical protein WS68_14165 [Burkholderia sp. TSV86]
MHGEAAPAAEGCRLGRWRAFAGCAGKGRWHRFVVRGGLIGRNAGRFALQPRGAERSARPIIFVRREA